MDEAAEKLDGLRSLPAHQVLPGKLCCNINLSLFYTLQHNLSRENYVVT